MKILYVYGMAETKDIVLALGKLGYEVEEYPEQQDNAVLDDDKVDKIVEYVHTHEITHIMSIHLIYNLAAAAYKAEIKYVSVIWDAPYIKIYSPFGKLDNCWFSVFDRMDAGRFLTAGIPHVLYQPLSVNADDVSVWNRNSTSKLGGRYINDISFIGRLYEDNLYDKQMRNIPADIQDFFSRLFKKAVLHWDGINRIYGEVSEEILERIKEVNPELQVRNRLDIEDVEFFEIMYLVRKAANIERLEILNVLADRHKVTLYTISRIGKGQLEKVKIMPPVLPGKDAAVIYAGSKINLNVSLKGIEGGTPQRIIDAMGAGGFVLTNYCAETAQLFVEDKEIVMFRTLDELLEKAEYYLKHDEEREKIAKAGHDKVVSCYTYEKKIKQMLDWVEGKIDIHQLKEQVNELFAHQKYDEIKLILLSYKKMTEHDNDLAMLCYLCTVYDQEKEAGQETIFSKVSGMEEVLERYTALKFYLRRIDFDIGNDDLGAFYQFLSQQKISSYELLRAVDFGVVHKDKTLRRIKGEAVGREKTEEKKDSIQTASQDEIEICFIICTNNRLLAEECIYYIHQLTVPDGMQIDILTVEEAHSMTSGYNEAMRYSSAKYKVYLHHDTYIVNPDFIQDCLDIFMSNPQIGMIGNVGVKAMPASGVMWDADRFGMVYEQHIYETQLLANKIDSDLAYLEVDAIDGFLMVTQYDIPWREDLFTKWDFYDCSQSMEFIRAGYRVVVPNMEEPWCVHDCGFINLADYDGEKEKFIKEYLVAR